MKVVLVRHFNNPKEFLFETPFDLLAGTIVQVDTKNGKKDAIVTCDSANVDEMGAEMMANLAGGSMPLKKVVGAYVLLPMPTDDDTID